MTERSSAKIQVTGKVSHLRCDDIKIFYPEA